HDALPISIVIFFSTLYCRCIALYTSNRRCSRPFRTTMSRKAITVCPTLPAKMLFRILLLVSGLMTGLFSISNSSRFSASVSPTRSMSCFIFSSSLRSIPRFRREAAYRLETLSSFLVLVQVYVVHQAFYQLLLLFVVAELFFQDFLGDVNRVVRYLVFQV